MSATMVDRPTCVLPDLIAGDQIEGLNVEFHCPDDGCGAVYAVVWQASVAGPLLPFWKCVTPPGGSRV